jgi:hypothetical protein
MYPSKVTTLLFAILCTTSAYTMHSDSDSDSLKSYSDTDSDNDNDLKSVSSDEAETIITVALNEDNEYPVMYRIRFTELREPYLESYSDTSSHDSYDSTDTTPLNNVSWINKNPSDSPISLVPSGHLTNLKPCPPPVKPRPKKIINKEPLYCSDSDADSSSSCDSDDIYKEAEMDLARLLNTLDPQLQLNKPTRIQKLDTAQPHPNYTRKLAKVQAANRKLWRLYQTELKPMQTKLEVNRWDGWNPNIDTSNHQSPEVKACMITPHASARQLTNLLNELDCDDSETATAISLLLLAPNFVLNIKSKTSYMKHFNTSHIDNTYDTNKVIRRIATATQQFYSFYDAIPDFHYNHRYLDPIESFLKKMAAIKTMLGILDSHTLEQLIAILALQQNTETKDMLKALARETIPNNLSYTFQNDELENINKKPTKKTKAFLINHFTTAEQLRNYINTYTLLLDPKTSYIADSAIKKLHLRRSSIDYDSDCDSNDNNDNLDYTDDFKAIIEQTNARAKIATILLTAMQVCDNSNKRLKHHPQGIADKDARPKRFVNPTIRYKVAKHATGNKHQRKINRHKKSSKY